MNAGCYRISSLPYRGAYSRRLRLHRAPRMIYSAQPNRDQPLSVRVGNNGKHRQNAKGHSQQSNGSGHKIKSSQPERGKPHRSA